MILTKPKCIKKKLNLIKLSIKSTQTRTDNNNRKSLDNNIMETKMRLIICNEIKNNKLNLFSSGCSFIFFRVLLFFLYIILYALIHIHLIHQKKKLKWHEWWNTRRHRTFDMLCCVLVSFFSLFLVIFAASFHQINSGLYLFYFFFFLVYSVNTILFNKLLRVF